MPHRRGLFKTRGVTVRLNPTKELNFAKGPVLERSLISLLESSVLGCSRRVGRQGNPPLT